MKAVEEARLRAENEKLRETLGQILRGSLLDVRRAAFSPTIGCRYTEAVRSDISNACWRLEEAAREALERQA